MRLKNIFLEFKWKFAFTLFLVTAEALIALLIPLFIGFAIGGVLKGNHTGAFQLGALGGAIILIGGGRRFFDSRFYAQVFQKYGAQAVQKVSDGFPSVKTARLGMLKEVVEFLENSLPELITNVLGLVGVVIIIAGLNTQVFIGGLVVTFLVFLIYFLTSKRTMHLNAQYNDELERQVDVIATNDATQLDAHLKGIMKWNIKLSDLEMVNFSISWLIMMSFLVTSIILSVQGDVADYGALFALVMYVFQYIENVATLPFFYQSWLRLSEIRERLEKI